LVWSRLSGSWQDSRRWRRRVRDDVTSPARQGWPGPRQHPGGSEKRQGWPGPRRHSGGSERGGMVAWRWRQVGVASATATVWGSCRRCGVALSSLPPLPSRPRLLLWTGRQPCVGEERRIWLLSGGAWRWHVDSSGPDGVCGCARASGSGASQRLLPGMADGRCSAR
jgi:hypothetical protein